MPLRNACFISYRHGQHDLMKTFIDDFHKALNAELEPLCGSDMISIDKERLKDGDFYNEALASELCQSACMVVVYVPTYFHNDSRYCAREFAAMPQLESERLKRLPKSTREQGLIVPVVLRGFAELPASIAEQRHCYNFEDYALGDRRLSRHPKCRGQVRQLAAYISERFRSLVRLPETNFRCDEFKLPSENHRDVAALVSDGFPPLPGRRRPR
jgi:hypothetical protein